ncbi:MAG: hypothetical protein HQK54_13485 [Oligoflexales bacterium]|nr:hypothetical protein [Oligoflexales bacterium]
MMEKFWKNVRLALEGFQGFLLRMFDKALSNHVRVAIGFTAFLIFMAPWIARMRIFVSPDDMIGRSVTSTVRYRDLRREFRLGHSVQLTFFRKDKGPLIGRDVCALRKIVTEEAFTNKDLSDISSPLHLRRGEWTGDRYIFFLVLDDPCRSMNVPYDLSPLQKTPFSPLFTGREKNDLTFEFSFRGTEEIGRFGEFDPALIGILKERISRKLESEGGKTDFVITGYPYYKLGVLKGLSEANFLNLLLLVLLCLAMRVFFGRWLAGFIAVFTLVAMGAILFGFMGLFSFPHDPLCAGLFMIVSIAAAQDVLFLTYQMLKSDDNWHDVMRSYILPCFMTSFTTIIGFGSLCISNLETIQRFGFLAALGAFLEWLITFYYLPSILKFFPSFRNWVCAERAVSIKGFFRIASFVPGKPVLYAMLAIFVMSPLTILMLSINDNPETTFAGNHPVPVGIGYLKRTRGWINQFNIVFNDAEKKDINSKILSEFLKQKNITYIDDPYATIDYFAKGVPFNKRTVVKPAIMMDRNYSHMFSLKGRALATVYSNTYDMKSIASIMEMGKRLCPLGECEILGPSISYFEFSQKVIPTLIESLVLCLALIVTTLIVLCYAMRIRSKAKIIYSAVWGALSITGLVKLLGLDVNYVVCIFASVLLGVAGDNTIQFIFSDTGLKGDIRKGVEEKGTGSLQIAIITMLISLILIISDFKSLRSLGILFSCGIFFVLAGDLWVLQGILNLRDERKTRDSKNQYQK